MPFSLTVPDEYGYVVLTALGLIPILSFGQGVVVGRCRKAAGIPYPNPYATAAQAKESPAAHTFNCAQRAHGQLLENMPQHMLSMMFAGLEFPRATALLGVGWIISRLLYAWGYLYGGSPGGKGRLIGAGFWVMQGGVWGLCIATAIKML